MKHTLDGYYFLVILTSWMFCFQVHSADINTKIECVDLKLIQRGKKIIAKNLSRQCNDNLSTEIYDHIQLTPTSYNITSITLPFKTKLDIIEFLPIFIQNFIGEKGHSDGPNCYNSSLAPNGLSPLGSRSDWPTDFFLSLFKEELVQVERPRFGDIVLFHDNLDESINHIEEDKYFLESLYHAGFYLINDFIFTKNGEDRQAPYKIDTIKNSIETYATYHAMGLVNDESSYIPLFLAKMLYGRKARREFHRFLDNKPKYDWSLQYGGYFLLRRTDNIFHYSNSIGRDQRKMLSDIRLLLDENANMERFNKINKEVKKIFVEQYESGKTDDFLSNLQSLNKEQAILIYEILNSFRQIKNKYNKDFGPSIFKSWMSQIKITKEMMIITGKNLKNIIRVNALN
ncbi:MAG: hypothetical protein HOE90_08570 [Bacteriovoracaceae bacterium]|jgi:hypothetical protein|nr:hypothetical protein [Bacteriovoracaceae bacterium]